MAPRDPVAPRLPTPGDSSRPGMALGPTRSELQAAHCLELKTDTVPRDRRTTAFRQELRLRQARWREGRGYPIGDEPITGGRRARLLGSRIEFEYAIRTGANLVTPRTLGAARHRVASPERGQRLDALRLWADLLSSMPLCFNLSGTSKAIRARPTARFTPGVRTPRVGCLR